MGGVHPCSVGWELTHVMARAPAPRMLATISTTSHPGHWSRARKGGFSNSLNIEMVR
jgi:hypothetical protein